MRAQLFNAGVQQKFNNSKNGSISNKEKNNPNLSFKNQMDWFKLPEYEQKGGIYYRILPNAKVPIGPRLPVSAPQVLNQIADASNNPSLVRETTNGLYQSAVEAYNPTTYQLNPQPIQDYVAKIDDPQVLTTLGKVVDTMIDYNQRASSETLANNLCSESARLGVMKRALNQRLQLPGDDIAFPNR